MSEKFYYQRKVVAPGVMLWTFGGSPTLEQWNACTQAATQWLREEESRGCRWSVVVDPSAMTNMSATLRRAAAEWRAANMPLIANTVLCACYVAEGAVIRGTITAIFWIARPVVPVSLRSCQQEALRWIRDKTTELSFNASAI